MKNKSIAKNSILNIIYKGLSVFFPFITTTYTSHILKAEGVGRVSYATTIVSYFTVLAALGIPQYGIRIIAQSSQNIRLKSKSFIELFIINGVSTVICIFAYYLIINLVPYFRGNLLLHNVMGITLILNLFNIDWFYEGIEEYSYIIIRSLIIKTFSIFFMLLTVKTQNDYVVYGLISCIAIAGNNIFNVFHLRKYIKIEKYRLCIKKHLRSVFILLASSMATEIYTMLDTVLIKHYYNETYIGYYSNSVRVVRMIYSISTAAVAVFYPRISHYFKEKNYEGCDALLNKGLLFLLICAIPSMIGLMLIAKYIVYYMFGVTFIPATVTILILSPLVLVFSLAYLLGSIVLLSVGEESKILITTIVAAITNFSLNMILIPYYAHNGAAVASVIAEILVTSFLIVQAKKHYTIKISRHFIYSITISTTIMVIVCLPLLFFLKFSIESMVIIIICAIFAYGSALLITKNEVILFLVKKIHRMRK